jgi:hypothetical protein
LAGESQFITEGYSDSFTPIVETHDPHISFLSKPAFYSGYSLSLQFNLQVRNKDYHDIDGSWVFKVV